MITGVPKKRRFVPLAATQINRVLLINTIFFWLWLFNFNY